MKVLSILFILVGGFVGFFTSHIYTDLGISSFWAMLIINIISVLLVLVIVSLASGMYYNKLYLNSLSRIEIKSIAICSGEVLVFFTVMYLLQSYRSVNQHNAGLISSGIMFIAIFAFYSFLIYKFDN